MSAVIERASKMDSVEPGGGLGGTYAGNPIACVAALAVLDIVAEERLCKRGTVFAEALDVLERRLRRANST